MLKVFARVLGRANCFYNHVMCIFRGPKRNTESHPYTSYPPPYSGKWREKGTVQLRSYFHVSAGNLSVLADTMRLNGFSNDFRVTGNIPSWIKKASWVKIIGKSNIAKPKSSATKRNVCVIWKKKIILIACWCINIFLSFTSRKYYNIKYTNIITIYNIKQNICIILYYITL